MAKNGAVKWLGLALTILVLVGGLAVTWGVYGSDIKGNSKNHIELKEDGCKPSQAHTTQIAVIQTTQQTMQRDIADIKEQVTDGFAGIQTTQQTILDRLPKKE